MPEATIVVESPPAFTQNLMYFDNGNIQTLTINNKGNGNWPVLTFNYNYDIYNRLTNAACNNSNYSEIFNYDNHGNFTSRIRTGGNKSYSYFDNTNRCSTVNYQGAGLKSFTYDYAGNIKGDGRRGFILMKYDRRNLLLSYVGNNLVVGYNYDDTGQRIFKNTGSNGVKEYYLRDHTGKELALYDMNNGGKLKSLNLYGNGLLGKVNVTWIEETCYDEAGNPSTCYRREDERFYYIKDHLGNIRITIDRDGEVVSAQDYYAYGEALRSYNAGDANARFKFTEKERDTESGYHYFACPPK